MTSLTDFATKQRHFQRRKRALRVRDIIEQFEDKSIITPELIIQIYNNNTSSSSMDDQDPLSLEEAWRILEICKDRFIRKSPDDVSSCHWLLDRLFRFTYVVWKLGGVDKAKADEILEAMRINSDDDYFLTLDHVEFNLCVNADCVKGSLRRFNRSRRRLDLMFPAPLIADDSESLSLDLADKLTLGANKSIAAKNKIRASGSGPMRRARRSKAAVDSSLYTKMDVVDDSGP